MSRKGVRTREGAMIAALLVCAAFVPLPAAAYAGPGAGISALGTLFAIASAFFLAIAGFVWYPVKRLIRWIKRGGANSKKTGAE